MKPSTWGDCPDCPMSYGFPRVPIDEIAADPVRSRCRACGAALVLTRLPAPLAEPATLPPDDRCGLTPWERRESARLLDTVLGGVV